MANAKESLTEVVRAKRKTMKALNLNDSIEDMLITLGKHYHLIRPTMNAVPGRDGANGTATTRENGHFGAKQRAPPRPGPA